jgi:UDP-N-acetylmuramate--alanine ligase
MMKVGIFFGGPSREREISFAGGRTVYDNLDKTLFDPIPIFVDSHKNLILLDWEYIYKGTIRDFYPPVNSLPPSPNGFQIYLESLGELDAEQQEQLSKTIGRPLTWEELPQLIDIAFLALHGAFGEDGQIQQIFEGLNLPYTGSGVTASQIGMDKALQKSLMGEKGFSAPDIIVYSREAWINTSARDAYEMAIKQIGFPIVIRPANQGSSIGVSIVNEEAGLEGFELAVNRAFFREAIPVLEWKERSDFDRLEYVRFLSDIRDGLGFPLDITLGEHKEKINHPEALLEFLNTHAAEADDSGIFLLESQLSEQKVIIESFIDGKEFSCIVIRTEDGQAVALPPTEILKGKEVFDYRSKYMPGMSRKITPIGLPDADILAIREECERLFNELGFHVYARIDGFITADKSIFLNDPNTTSGMLPSSFFFHQAAEIGLNPSQFLTYIVRISLQERLEASPDAAHYRTLLEQLDQQLIKAQEASNAKEKIAVILGGYSFERHISVESGRNVFEKLASSASYEPVPVFLGGSPEQIQLYQIPINLLLKDNADDIRDKIATFKKHPVVEDIKKQCVAITSKYASKDVVFEPVSLTFEDLASITRIAFIALHGRPGEDGQIQQSLEAAGICYNGSDPASAAITINKYNTLQTLKRNGFPVTNQLLVSRVDYVKEPEEFFLKVESQFTYPFIGKPVDDGCSSAVKILKNRKELEAFSRLMFRPEAEEGLEARRILRLGSKEEFPRKKDILFEQLIESKGAAHFLEITGGLLTHYEEDGAFSYEVFEPSEVLASGDVLSLEEKFLAGEGQNITPARFSDDPEQYQKIADQVKKDLEKAARILNVQGYARIDAFVRIFEDGRVETIIIEVNALPGMTPATCIFHQAAINGYKPSDFIHKILDYSLQKNHMAGAAPKAAEALAVKAPATPPIVPTPADSSIAMEQVAPEPIYEQASSTIGNTGGFQPQSTGGYLKDRLLTQLGKLKHFLLSPFIIRNFGGLFLAFFALFFLIKWSLNLYTRHGESIQIPDFTGMEYNEAVRKAKRQDFKMVAIDSFFDSKARPNTIYQQSPEPMQRAKEGRTIYVSKYRVMADSAILPSLVSAGYDYDQYRLKLKRLDIKAVVKERVFDSKQEENSILHFFHKGKKITDNMIRRGVKVPKGSTLEFVITERITNEVAIPNLVCKRYDAADFLISTSKLVVGQVFGEVAGRSNAYVYKQDPPYVPGKMIQKGEKIDLYLSTSLPTGCKGGEDPANEDQPEEDNEDF